MKALTIIDVGTFLLEIVPYDDKQAVSIAKLFDQEWLCRYPRPERVIHDNGNEFIGAEFQEMIHNFDITPKPTTVKNPQANSVIERVHLTIGNRCRMEEFHFDDWEEKVRSMFKSISWAVRSTIHSVAKFTPGQLAFGVDMLMRTKIVADWEFIKAEKLCSAEMSNERENKCRITHEYKKNDHVLIVLKVQGDGTSRKMQCPMEGPYKVLKVNTNGTLRIR